MAHSHTHTKQTNTYMNISFKRNIVRVLGVYFIYTKGIATITSAAEDQGIFTLTLASFTALHRGPLEAVQAITTLSPNITLAYGKDKILMLYILLLLLQFLQKGKKKKNQPKANPFKVTPNHWVLKTEPEIQKQDHKILEESPPSLCSEFRQAHRMGPAGRAQNRWQVPWPHLPLPLLAKLGLATWVLLQTS